MFKIYSKPNCINCDKLKQYCNEENIKYNLIDITIDFKAKAKMISEGFRGLPVIEIDNKLYGGDVDNLIGKVSEYK